MSLDFPLRSRPRPISRIFAAFVLLAAGCSSGEDRADPLGSGGTSASAGGSAGSGALDGGAAGDEAGGGRGSGGTTGSETDCSDGRDDDEDRLIDCADPECAAHCKDSCDEPFELLDGSAVSGDTTGHAGVLDASCSSSQSGSEVVYRLSVANAGLLRVSLTDNSANLSVSVRRTCDAVESELACTSSFASVPVEKDEVVYVVVDGVESIDAGRYALRVESAVIECGNGFREQEEECDDGEPRDGDGCSAECTIESNESSSNDTPETADEFVAPRYFGAILPAGDVDVIAVDVSQAGTSILARTEDFSDGACRLGLMDTEVEIIGTDAATVLASNDDRAFDDFCSETQAHNLLAGRYYVRVRAAEAGSVPTFGYALDVVLVR